MKQLDHLVSVITPVFNGAAYIQQTVESVANQTIKVLEHVVIDDGSNDETLEILASLKARFPHLVVLTQTNQGAGVARNKGMEYATGKYIAFLDSDDGWSEHKLASQIDFMEKNSVLFSYGDYDEVDEATGKLLMRFSPPEQLSYADLLNGCPIGCLTAAYNQQALGKCYMPLVRRGQDWGLWLVITRKGVVARKYPGNFARYNSIQSSLSKNKYKKMFDVYQIYSQEQGFGMLRSIYHLIRHILYVQKKRKVI
jgi:glycosyltransferase involved in cell wall biosynthesis